MAFDFLKKRKKYPFNKKAPPTAVYAGPEYFARRNGRIYAGPERFGSRDADVEIYAGPEYFEDELPPKEIGEVFEELDAPLPPDEDERYNTVYAGPEPRVNAPVYAGPEGARKPGLLVYAGPEFFERRRAEKEDISALASGVYAGPEPPAGGMAAAVPPPPKDGQADEEA